MSEQNGASKSAFDVVLTAIENELIDLHSFLFEAAETVERAEATKARLTELEVAQAVIEGLRGPYQVDVMIDDETKATMVFDDGEGEGEKI